MSHHDNKRDKVIGKMLTSKEVRERLRIGRATLYRWIDQGKLKPYKFGRNLKFDEKEIEEFISSHREE
jgi:excisionase family DNA binding protein